MVQDTSQATQTVLIFLSGTGSPHPGAGGWGTMIATPDGKVIEYGGQATHTTQKRMELTAALDALEKTASLNTPVDIYTSSEYLVEGVSNWLWSNRAGKWLTSEEQGIANSILWEKLARAVGIRHINWKYVSSEGGTPGNERTAEIAKGFSKGAPPSLYNGTLIQYKIAVYIVLENAQLPSKELRETFDADHPYSFLSLVGGLPVRHETFESCKVRIQGQQNAKYEKALSSEDEIKILKHWGFGLGDLIE